MTTPNMLNDAPPLLAADLEGVFLPEIWIAVADASGIPELRLTTRDVADYDELMQMRLGILRKHGLRLQDIQSVIAGLDLLPGASVSRRSASHCSLDHHYRQLLRICEPPCCPSWGSPRVSRMR